MCHKPFRAFAIFAVLISLNVQAGPTSTPATKPSVATPETIVAGISRAVAAKLAIPVKPARPETKSLTQVQADDRRKTYDADSAAYQEALRGLPKKVDDRMQVKKLDGLPKDVEWTAQVQDVKKDGDGFTVEMASDSGIKIIVKLPEESKKDARNLRKGQFVTVSGTVEDLTLAPELKNRLEDVSAKLETLIASSLAIQVKPTKIEPVKTLAIGLVLSTDTPVFRGGFEDIKPAMARDVITGLSDKALFSFQTGPYQPKAMTRAKLLAATAENKDTAIAMSKGLSLTFGGSVVPQIRDVYRAVMAAPAGAGKRMLLIYAGDFNDDDLKKLGQLFKDASGKITVCLWMMKDPQKIAPKLLDQFRENGVIFRSYPK